jgi:hypothetical protein
MYNYLEINKTKMRIGLLKFIMFLSLFLFISCGHEDQNVTSIEITNPGKENVFCAGEYVTIWWKAIGPVYETNCMFYGGFVDRTCSHS